MLVNSAFLFFSFSFRINQLQQFFHRYLPAFPLILIKNICRLSLGSTVFFSFFFFLSLFVDSRKIILAKFLTFWRFAKIYTREIFKSLSFAKISTREIRFFLARENKYTRKLVRLRYLRLVLICCFIIRFDSWTNERQVEEKFISRLQLNGISDTLKQYVT